MIRSSAGKYDFIQVSLIDSWAATTSGAFALAENSLYTIEAFEDYFKHLTPQGILSVSRYLFVPRTQALRAAILAKEALARLGVSDPASHIIAIGTTDREGMATILAKRAPFTVEELNQLTSLARKFQFVPLYLSGLRGDPAFEQGLGKNATDAFFRNYPFDIRPTTDDWPFFFQSVRLTDSFKVFTGELSGGQSFNNKADFTLYVLCIISTALVGLLYVVPLTFQRAAKRLPARWVVYFLAIGVGVSCWWRWGLFKRVRSIWGIPPMDS